MGRHPLTDRDMQMLAGLDRCPLTAQQLLKLSETFAQPFGHERRLRRRLQALCEQGWVRRWRLASASPGAANYYTLSPEGWRLLYGDERLLPHPRRFGPTAGSRIAHMTALGDFLTHTYVAAHAAGVPVVNFRRENELRLEIPGASLYPDAAFELITPLGAAFRFYVELDNATEPVTWPREIDTWNREATDCWELKIRFYEALYQLKRERFRVLAVTTAGEKRMGHILETAARLVHYPRRCVVYGVTLREYLDNASVLTGCLRNHRGESVSLVPQREHVPRLSVRATVALCYSAAPAGSQAPRDRDAPSCVPQPLSTHHKPSAIAGPSGL